MTTCVALRERRHGYGSLTAKADRDLDRFLDEPLSRPLGFIFGAPTINIPYYSLAHRSTDSSASPLSHISRLP